MGLGDLFKAVLAIEGGIHPALFLIALGGLIYVWYELRQSEKARREEHGKCTEQAAAAFEKRLEEQRPTLTALERNITAMAALTHSIDSRTQAINDLVAGFAQLVNTMDMRREVTNATIARVEQRQEQALVALNALATELAKQNAHQRHQ